MELGLSVVSMHRSSCSGVNLIDIALIWVERVLEALSEVVVAPKITLICDTLPFACHQEKSF